MCANRRAALSLFRTALKNWTRARPHRCPPMCRVNDLLETRLRSATPDWHGCRKKAPTTRTVSTSGLVDCRSDRRHPRLSCRPRGLVRQLCAGRGQPAGAAAVSVPASDEFFLRRARRWCYAQRCSVAPRSAPNLDCFPRGWSEATVEHFNRSSDDVIRHPRIAPWQLRLCRVAQGTWMRLCRRPNRTGTLRGNLIVRSEW